MADHCPPWQIEDVDWGYTYRERPRPMHSDHWSGTAFDVNISMPRGWGKQKEQARLAELLEPPGGVMQEAARAIGRQIDELVRQLASTTATPTLYTTPEAPMGNYFEIPTEFTRFLTGVEQATRAPKIGTEEYFAKLDVQEGDRIRLTQLAPATNFTRGAQRELKDPAVLEGVVLGLKRKLGPSQVRIKGFDHTGGNSGGQHVWFPVDGYKVEVLHRVYRWTTEDRAIVAAMGIRESAWQGYSEQTRQSHREHWAPRIAKIKRALGLTDPDEFE